MLLDYTSFSSLFFYYNVYYPCPPIWRSPIFPLRVCTPGIHPRPQRILKSPPVPGAAASLGKIFASTSKWPRSSDVVVRHRHAGGGIAICEKMGKIVWGLRNEKNNSYLSFQLLTHLIYCWYLINWTILKISPHCVVWFGVVNWANREK